MTYSKDFNRFYLYSTESYYVGVILDIMTELGNSNARTPVMLIRQSRQLLLKIIKCFNFPFFSSAPKKGHSEP